MIQFFLINVMKKITFLICSLLFVGFSNAQQSKRAKDRPNVIIINMVTWDMAIRNLMKVLAMLRHTLIS